MLRTGWRAQQRLELPYEVWREPGGGDRLISTELVTKQHCKLFEVLYIKHKVKFLKYPHWADGGRTVKEAALRAEGRRPESTALVPFMAARWIS